MSNQRIIYLLGVFTVIFFGSCTKGDDTVGLEVQPEQNRLNINTLNIKAFQTYTSMGEALQTNRENRYVLLGSLNNIDFGKTTAFADVQYVLSTIAPDFGTDPKLIASTLFLSIANSLGNSSATLNYKIYKSNLDIDVDALYASDKDMNPYIGELISDTSITAESNQKSLQIHLDKIMSDGKKWGQDILESDVTTLSTNENFLKRFNGLYFTIDTNFSEEGALYKYDLNSENSYIQLEYSFTNKDGDLDTNVFKLQFNKETGRFNTYTNNPKPIKDILGKKGQSNIYISGLAGVKGNISLSSLLSWRDSAKIVIYKAELIAKAKSVEGFNIPDKLLLRVNTSDTSVRYVDDYLQGKNTNYDGSYCSKDKAYHWIVTRHIQRFINNEQNDSLIMIYPDDVTKTNLNRVILQNDLNKNPIHLRITYSKI